MRSVDSIILVGHGFDDGIKGPTGNIITWDETVKWVNTLPVKKVYFLSCNSYEASRLVQKQSLGFNGDIDGIFAAYAISYDYYLGRYALSSAVAILPALVERLGELATGGEKSETLSFECMGCGGEGEEPPPAPASFTSVSFYAYGLSGGSWSVTVTIGTQTYSSSSSTYLITVLNIPVGATITYTVASSVGFSASPASGTITVNATNNNVYITFSDPYLVRGDPGGLEGAEVWHWLLVFGIIFVIGILTITILIPYAKLERGLKMALILFNAADLAVLVVQILYLLEGKVDLAYFASQVGGFVVGLFAKLVITLPQVLDVVEMAIFGASVLVSIAAFLSSGTTSIILSIVAIAGGLLSYYWDFTTDLNDLDLIIG